jgi:hypothetical protein
MHALARLLQASVAFVVAQLALDFLARHAQPSVPGAAHHHRIDHRRTQADRQRPPQELLAELDGEVRGRAHAADAGGQRRPTRLEQAQAEQAEHGAAHQPARER